MEITPEVARLFDEVADLTPEEQARYFEQHRVDPELRRQVEALVAHDQAPDSTIVGAIREAAHGAVGPQAVTGPEAETRCGPYRLVRVIGRGGMGEVWLAERVDGLLKRSVALKLPYAGFHAWQFAERTHREREILESLVHPGIARLYDAGMAEGGRPFLALEFVEGTTLTAYCDEHRLTVRDRLTLFLQVLSAVQHAHAHLVIHRDLKPSNILVTPAGEVKLLDFGIAKLMTAGEARETELTEVGGRAFTVDYASPEQVAGQSVTTASDVYSLGMVLFELLSGERAYALKRDSRSALEQAILDADVKVPSQTVGDTARAQARSTTPRKLAAMLKGDLDTIILKALQKQPERRYSTVDAFRSDIERYLAGEPVLAQPESAWYRTRKFVSRHRLSVASAAAVFVALAAGLSVALWQARVARDEARTSAAVQQFIEDIFRANSREQPDPLKAQQTTARELLDLGRQKIGSSLNDAPTAKFKMMSILGELYKDLGLDDEAVGILRNRVQVAKARFGPNDRNVAIALTELGRAMHAANSVNEREKTLLEARQLFDRNRDFTSVQRADLLSGLAEHYQSTDLAKALDYIAQAVNLYRAARHDRGLAEAYYLKAVLHQLRSEAAQAEPLFADAIAITRRLDGDRDPSLPRFYSQHADSLETLMRFAEAEQSLKAGYDVSLAINGEDHVDTIQTGSRYGYFLTRTSRAREGLPYLRKAKDAVLRTRGADDSFHTPQILFSYGAALGNYGRWEESLENITQAVENRRRNRPGTRYLGQMLEGQSPILADLGRYDEAAKALDEAVEIRKKVGWKMDFANAAPRLRILAAFGRYDEMAPLIQQVYGPEAPAGTAFSFGFLRNIHAHAELARLRGNGAETLRLGSRISEAVTSSALRPYLKVWEQRGALLQGQGHLFRHEPQKAVTFLEHSLELSRALFDPASPDLANNAIFLADCYLDLGDRIRAAALAAEAASIHQAHPRLGIPYRKLLAALQARLGSTAEARR